MSVDLEIKETAAKLGGESTVSKSALPTSQQKLMKTLHAMGPDAIKARLESLNKAECKILEAALEEMKKAVSMDDAYAASYRKGDVYGTGADGKNGKGTVIQEDHANYDADEKLVKPEANKQNHQGNNDPEGKDDHKVADPDKKGNPMKKGGMNPAEMYKAIYDMTKSGESKDFIRGAMHKSASCQVVDQMMDFAFGEHERQMHSASTPLYRSVTAMAKAGESSQFMRGYGMAKGYDMGEVNKAISDVQDKGEYAFKAKCGCPADKHSEDCSQASKPPMEKAIKPGEGEALLEKAKEDGEATAKIKNPEEGQSKDDLEKLHSKKTRGDKSRPKELRVDVDNVAAQKNVNNLSQGGLKKSVDWAGSGSLLKSGAGGQNHHFSINEFYDSALKMVKDFDTAPLKKSLDASDDSINAVIERNEDASRDDVLTKSALAESQKPGELVLAKSFEDSEVAELMGFDTKTTKELLEG